MSETLKNKILEGYGFIMVSPAENQLVNFRKSYMFCRSPLGDQPLTYAVDAKNNLWVHWGKHIDLSAEGFRKREML